VFASHVAYLTLDAARIAPVEFDLTGEAVRIRRLLRAEVATLELHAQTRA
jgi:hypothetical protein